MRTRGYDPIRRYTVEELTELYISEGKPSDTALCLATELHRVINCLNMREYRMWDKARSNEILAGNVEEYLFPGGDEQ